MWGDVTPAERLRAITRRSRSDHDLAVEAVDALAGFAAQPAHLVVACRRVLAHHRSNAVLWWVCARLLAAPDPVAAARETTKLLEADRTASRLAATLPLLDDNQVVAVVGWREAVYDALSERQDIPAVRVDGEWDVPAQPVRICVVAAEAIGPDRAVVPDHTNAALDAMKPREVWLVGGVGRLLPNRLFDALAAAEPDAELLDLVRVDRIAGHRGVESPIDAARRVDCPIAPELLRPLD